MMESMQAQKISASWKIRSRVRSVLPIFRRHQRHTSLISALTYFDLRIAACLKSTVRYELICCLELIADIALAFEHAEELEVFVETVDLVPRLAAILKSK